MMILRVPAILLALTIHELSHGFTAYVLGDRTAKSAGRLTINPFAHLDVVGTLMLLFGPFGWAKPVPVNPYGFKNPKQGMAIVAVAGPLSNILLAGMTGLLFRFGLIDPSSMEGIFFYILFVINIGLAIFNLLPVYPLDGSRILMAFLNDRQTVGYVQAMNVVPAVFLGMIVVEWAFNIPLISYLLNPIFQPAFRLARRVFIGI